MTLETKKTYERLIKSLYDFLCKENHMSNKKYPKIRLDDTKQSDDIFITTGFFDNVNKEIVIFTRDRHIKDVLRTCSHEFIHYFQKERGILNDDDGKTTSLSDKRLEMLESEAYEKGNIGFRKWTEYYAKKQGKE